MEDTRGRAPRLDPRVKEDVEEEIRRLAAGYTPQWRFNREQPDAGTALAGLFAGLMEEAVGQYNRILDLDRRDMLKSLGEMPLEAGIASGYMALGLARPSLPECLAPAGTGIAAVTPGGGVDFRTVGDVWVSGAAVEYFTVEGTKAPGHRILSPGLYLCFSQALSPNVTSLLILLHRCQNPDGGSLTWEYRGADGWGLLEVEDGTDRFSHTGLVRFAPPPDMAAWEAGGLKGFWLRAAGEGDFKLGAALEGVCMNGVEAKAMKPGIGGNLPSEGRLRLTKTLGFVSSVRNPVCFYGGSKRETEGDFLDRSGARLRHGFRAVTPGDFESLTREVCRDALRVQCFPGRDESGRRAYGAVSVVILQRDFQEGCRYFYQIREQILDYLGDKVSRELLDGGGLFIIPPRFIRMDVRAEVYVRELDQVMEVRRRAREALEQFLDPVAGGYEGTGWDFGVLPGHLQLKNCLRHVEGVEYIKQLSCHCFQESRGGWQEAEPQQVRSFPWALPIGGDCSVSVRMMPGF